MTKQWAVQYRPTTLSEMVGNVDAVSRTKAFLSRRNAHAVLFHGPSGCGKSTLARIAANKLSGNTPADVFETNIGSERGISDVRNIVDQARYLPKHKCRVFILEECHAMTSQAKSALLRPIEDPPHDSVVFLLCTDRPWLLDAQILNRCLQIGVVLPSEDELTGLLQHVVSAEGAFSEYSDKATARVCREVARASGCVPRSALQMLQAASTSYKGYDSAKDLIVQSIRATESASIDKAALFVLGCIYSSSKPLEERVSYLAKRAADVDGMALLSRIQTINHALLQNACGNGPPAAYYYIKELKPMGGVPTVTRSTKVSLALANLRNSLTVVNMDPNHIILPTLLDLAITLTEDQEHD